MSRAPGMSLTRMMTTSMISTCPRVCLRHLLQPSHSEITLLRMHQLRTAKDDAEEAELTRKVQSGCGRVAIRANGGQHVYSLTLHKMASLDGKPCY